MGFLRLATFLAAARLLGGVALADDTAAATPPSDDPWYTAPEGYEDALPGALLRKRTAQGNIANKIGANCSAAFNLLYRTTASQGNATFAVTTVLVPKKPTNALLSYQIPYDSAYINSSPSYALTQGGIPSDIGIALGKGYFVTVPDYVGAVFIGPPAPYFMVSSEQEGPLASFTAGHMSGYATLDAVRVTLDSADLYGLPDESLYATWGYSGGALATEWAAELQADYAPELEFAGSAMGGLTPNVTSVLVSINKQVSAGLAPPAIIGLLSQWPAAKEWAYGKLTTNTKGRYTRDSFLAAQNYTLSQAEQSYEFYDIYQYFVDGLADLTSPEVQTVINQDGIMGLHGVPSMPVFAYKAIQDGISPVEDTDELVGKFCESGANILYQRNTVGTHGQEAVNGDADATAFLDAVLTGAFGEFYNTEGCEVVNVTNQVGGGSRPGWTPGLPSKW